MQIDKNATKSDLKVLENLENEDSPQMAERILTFYNYFKRLLVRFEK